MLGKDKPQGPGWVRAVPALCLSPWEPRGAEAALSAAGRAGQDLENLVPVLENRAPEAPLQAPCCIQQQGGLNKEGYWQEGHLQPTGGLCGKPGDIPGAPCS